MVRVLVCFTAMIAASGCGGKQSRNRAAPAPVAPPVSVAAGTELTLRTVELIDAADAVEGKSWAAVLARDVRTSEGDLLVGAGSPVYLGVRRDAGGLQLTLRSVVAGGNSYLAGVPLTTTGTAVTGLEPWGDSATAKDIRLNGPKIFVPGQALIAVKLSQALSLR